MPTLSPVIDLSTTTFPGIPEGETRWWRCQAMDGSGLWSDWSDWVQWRRVARPTVTITSPADGGIVQDPTPTVTWTVTGGVQESYRVELWNTAMTRRWYNSGRIVSSAAREHTVPATVRLSDDEASVYVVTVWDDQPRLGSVDDPAFSQDSATATFDRDGSLTPTTMVMYPTPDEVGMVLTWTRPADPGRWVVLRDGQVVDVVDSADVATPGGWALPLLRTTELLETTPLGASLGWSWTDWTADPRRDHTWEVAPVVEGVAGKGHSLTGRLEPVGVWLVRPQDGQRVMVTNDDVPSGWGMVEQSSSHLPLGARRPVLVTQGMGGYQGRTSGELTGMDHRGGPSAQDQRDTFLALKARQGQTLRMVLADQNLAVATWGMTVAPAPAGPHLLRFAVSWEWAQVADFDYEPLYL